MTSAELTGPRPLVLSFFPLLLVTPPPRLKNRFPSTFQREQLAAKIGLTPRKVRAFRPGQRATSTCDGKLTSHRRTTPFL